ncbi:MAG: hypothetical protein RRB13_03920 [bacterium]|nr:hypothetical protein [bacterium]
MSFSRRKVIQLGGQAVIWASCGATLTSLMPEEALAIEWKALLGIKQRKGKAKLIELDGTARIGNEELKVGQMIANGQLIEADHEARLLLSMPDGSAFQLSGPAQLKLEIDEKGGGVLELLLGGLLGIVLENRDARYLVQSPTATAGIKGTVFYRERFGPDSPPDPRIPEGALEYFCICNGELEMFDHGADKLMIKDQAEHHHAHMITQKGETLELVEAKFLYGHDDFAINRAIEAMGQKKHDRSWLKLDEQEADGY